MNRHQSLILISASVLLILLGFVLDTKPRKHQLVEKSRVTSFETISINALVDESRTKLPPAKQTYVQTLEAELTGNDTSDLSTLELLSGTWFDASAYAMAGYYAEKIAKVRNDAESWSLLGTTCLTGIMKSISEKEKEYCFQKAVPALEVAASLGPENINHRINLALCYAELPPDDKPMHGIQLLLGLNEKYPENPAVLTQLGRLAIKTGQFERAVERLTAAVRINPEGTAAQCLLAEALTGAGKTTEAAEAQAKCNELNNKQK